MSNLTVIKARCRRLSLTLILGGAAVAVAMLSIQDGRAQSEPANSSTAAEIEPIVVTARRRDEDLQRVPASIAVLSADDLQERQVTTQSDLQLTTPGLVVRESQSSSQQNYAIRGQSIDAYSSSQPAVLPYVDEFQNATIAPMAFYDLSSVQVLKGPQGTLFGRNTTGGAVLYTTTKPDFSGVEGYATASFGNYSSRKFEAAVNLPASDTLAIRLAGISNRRDGYVRNEVTGTDLDEIHSDSARVSVLWRPVEKLEVNLVAQYDRSYGAGDALELYSVYAPGQVGPGPAFYPLTSTAAGFYTPALLDALAGPGAYAALQKAFPGAPAGGIFAALARQSAAGTLSTWLNEDPTHDANSQLVISNVRYEFAPDLVIKNIAGYSSNYSNDGADVDGSPFGIVSEPRYANTSDQISEEFQLSGKTLSERLDYITGIYLSRQRSTLNETFQAFDVGPIANAFFHLPEGKTEAGVSIDKSEGVFLQGSYDLDAWLHGLSFTAGARYTWEQIDFTSVAGFTPDTNEREQEDDPSWTAGLEYQLNPQLMLYVENRGSWRTGGFNVTSPPIDRPATAGGNRFAPEKTHDVEIGVKFQGDVGSVPLRMNVAAYNQWVDDLQRVVYVIVPGLGPNSLTANVPGGETVRGLEFDAEIHATHWLQMGAAFNYTDATYGNPHSLVIFGTPVDFDSFADLTKYSGSVYGKVTLPVPDPLGRVSLRSDLYAQSSQFFSNTAGSSTPGTTLPAYHLVNARLDWEDVNRTHLSVSAYVKNLTDKQYYVGGLAIGGNLGTNAAVPGEPRMYGIELGYKF
jgi:iron complex outermembrane receptor protein